MFMSTFMVDAWVPLSPRLYSSGYSFRSASTTTEMQSTSHGFTVRVYDSPFEILQLTQLEAECFGTRNQPVTKEWSVLDPTDLVSDLVLVAVDATTDLVIGGVQASWVYANRQSLWYASSMVVDLKWRRQGVGKALLELLLSNAKDARVDVIALHVQQDNIIGKSFYRSAGFMPFSSSQVLSEGDALNMALASIKADDSSDELFVLEVAH